MVYPQDMYPFQPTWSTTRINLLQRCPRAFVLRYGLAKLSKNHPQGKFLSEVFQIQTPWILMHQTIRTVLLDYVEDHQIGTVWSRELLSIRFRRDYFKAIAERKWRKLYVARLLGAASDVQDQGLQRRPDPHVSVVWAA